MSDKQVRRLKGWEQHVYLWIEQESSIMLKAVDAKHGDPVELSADDARRLANLLLEAAKELEAMD